MASIAAGGIGPSGYVLGPPSIRACGTACHWSVDSRSGTCLRAPGWPQWTTLDIATAVSTDGRPLEAAGRDLRDFDLPLELDKQQSCCSSKLDTSAPEAKEPQMPDSGPWSVILLTVPATRYGGWKMPGWFKPKAIWLLTVQGT
jgi:hypothetical protein